MVGRARAPGGGDELEPGGQGAGWGLPVRLGLGISHRGRDNASKATTILTASSAPETEPSASPWASPHCAIVCTRREGQHISLRVH